MGIRMKTPEPKTAAKAWTKPEFHRIGKIADVAGGSGTIRDGPTRGRS
jgi:hypothetical protein